MLGKKRWIYRVQALSGIMNSCAFVLIHVYNIKQFIIHCGLNRKCNTYLTFLVATLICMHYITSNQWWHLSVSKDIRFYALVDCVVFVHLLLRLCNPSRGGRFSHIMANETGHWCLDCDLVQVDTAYFWPSVPPSVGLCWPPMPQCQCWWSSAKSLCCWSSVKRFSGATRTRHDLSYNLGREDKHLNMINNGSSSMILFKTNNKTSL